MEISFVIVNHRSKDFLEKCLVSLRKNASNIGHEIIIVNNDTENLDDFSNDGIRVINTETNQGFANACNVGAKIAKGKVLFFLNPDAELLTANIYELINKFDADSSIGIVAPELISPNGKIQQWSNGESITLWSILKNNFGFSKNKVSQDDISWTSGAALAIRRNVFEELEGFDENFFMYFEDVDLCKRVLAHGAKILMMPQIKILHIGGQSANNSNEQKKHYYASQDHYFKKHFGQFQLFVLKFLRFFH